MSKQNEKGGQECKMQRKETLKSVGENEKRKKKHEEFMFLSK